MPRPLHHGRPGAGSDVIPDGWATAHAPIVEDTFDCTITIGPAGGAPSFAPDTRVTAVPTLAPIYTGPASVGLASVGGTTEDRRVQAAEDQVDLRAYVVKIPATDPAAAAVRVDHVITVTASPTGNLVGARLIVAGIATPGREFSRVISARVYN